MFALERDGVSKEHVNCVRLVFVGLTAELQELYVKSQVAHYQRNTDQIAPRHVQERSPRWLRVPVMAYATGDCKAMVHVPVKQMPTDTCGVEMIALTTALVVVQEFLATTLRVSVHLELEALGAPLVPD
eukprot:PhF_6_TR38617/c0_g1_i1/m.57541